MRLRVVVLALVGLAVLGCTAEADPPSSPAPDEIVLRLQDFDDGWEIGDDSTCSPYGREGLNRTAVAIVSEDPPSHCFRQFERPAESGDGWLQVDSEVLIFSSEDVAQRALAVIEEFLEYSGHPDLQRSNQDPLGLGDEARWLTSVSSQEPRWTVAAWRGGAVVNAVAVAGYSDAEGVARQFAEKQQTRLHDPEPASNADTEDAQAALNRGDLGVSVFWLGETFEPGSGLPVATIARSYARLGPGDGPGNNLQIEYDTADGDPGPRLWLWTPGRWDAFLQSEMGALSIESACGDPEVIELDDRRIEIHEVGDPVSGESCGGFVGHVYFDDVVVAINIPICRMCRPTPGPYGSDRGIEAAGRGLTPR